MIPRLHFVQEDEQLLIETFTHRRVVNGPNSYFSRPLERVMKRKALQLGPTDYVVVRNMLTGELHNEIGPLLYFLEANEEEVEVKQAIPLREYEYVRILDRNSGQVRVERGEQIVYLEPTEKTITPVRSGTEIDDWQAVLVRNTQTGQLMLITEKQLYIPAANEEVVEVRDRLRLEDHEVAIIKDHEGRYEFRYGSSEERSFFLDPYTELVTLRWSSGIHKDQRTLKVSKIDLRPKFMWYEFEVRTQDNVELVIGVTLFWQIMDVQQMINTTDDTPGDICSHARSVIIQAVSRTTLEVFLANFNTIVQNAVINDTDTFYDERGSVIKAVEVRSIACKDPDTQRILNEIIMETTNRLNRLQKQESENEVSVKQIEGEIETESRRGSLLESRREHDRLAARIVGESEADKVRMFFEELGDGLSVEDKLMIYQTLRKQDMLAVLSKGSSRLFYTPNDVDLSIETH